MSILDTVYSIKQVYPGLEDELCSRHSVALTQIRNKFGELYDGYRLGLFVIAKGLCQFGGAGEGERGEGRSGGYMALENGVTITLARTQPKQNLYINYNKWQHEINSTLNSQPQSQPQQELILNYKGQPLCQPTLSPSSSKLAHQLAQIYKLAIEDLSLQKIYGGILYIDSKLEDGCFYEREALVWAFFVAVLQINGVAEEYSVGEIRGKLGKYWEGVGLDGWRMERYARVFDSRHDSVVVNGKLYQMAKGTKFIMCKLPAIDKFRKDKGNSVVERLEEFQAGQFRLLEEGKISLEGFLAAGRQYWLSQKQPQQQPALTLHKCITASHGLFLPSQPESPYLALLIPNSQAPQLIKQLSSQLKAHFEIENNAEDIIGSGPRNKGGKWARDGRIKEILFSSQGCVGFSVFDARDQMWFVS